MSDEVDCQRTLRRPVTPYPVWVLAWVCYTVSVCIYTVFVYICVCTSVCACLYVCVHSHVLVHSCAFMSVCSVLGYKSMCMQRVWEQVTCVSVCVWRRERDMRGNAAVLICQPVLEGPMTLILTHGKWRSMADLPPFSLSPFSHPVPQKCR